MIPPEVLLDRLLREYHERDKYCLEEKSPYKYITGRVPIENFSAVHEYRQLVDWMNQQLSDIGVNSTGGRLLPPIHFDLVRVLKDFVHAHVFEADGVAFMVVTRPMIAEMWRYSRALVEQCQAFMRLQIAPDASFREIAQLLLFMQFCIVTAHEYSHVVRHWDDSQPVDIGESLSQAQELDADGYGIYHNLTYFFHGRGRLLTSQWLRISDNKALDNAILDTYLLSMMLQFCARWTGKTQMVWSIGAKHPPPAMRIEYSILFLEMWCREVGRLSTSWKADETLNRYFGAVASLFPPTARTSWDSQMSWLASPEGQKYRMEIRKSLDRIRTGRIASQQ